MNLISLSSLADLIKKNLRGKDLQIKLYVNIFFIFFYSVSGICKIEIKEIRKNMIVYIIFINKVKL